MRRAMAPAMLLVMVWASGLQAQEAASDPYILGPFEIERNGPDSVFLGVGAYEPLTEQKSSFAANPEYRFGRKLFVLGPALGLVVNADGGLYGYAGVYADIAIGPAFVTPQLAVGGYRQGDSLDLGGVLQFREALDVAYGFANGIRVGVRIAHISNAGIHDANPGVEEAYLGIAFPVGF